MRERDLPKETASAGPWDRIARAGDYLAAGTTSLVELGAFLVGWGNLWGGRIPETIASGLVVAVVDLLRRAAWQRIKTPPSR